MTWEAIREAYPHQWLLVEAIKAHTKGDKRVVEDFNVLGSFHDSVDGWEQYGTVHARDPYRELYVVSSEAAKLDIREQFALPMRGVRIKA